MQGVLDYSFVSMVLVLENCFPNLGCNLCKPLIRPANDGPRLDFAPATCFFTAVLGVAYFSLIILNFSDNVISVSLLGIFAYFRNKYNQIFKMNCKHDDYLKYWRIVRHYYRLKHNLSPADLDMILYLKSEQYFGKAEFETFNKVLPWDKKRFERLVKEGYIENFRARGRRRALYKVTKKTMTLCTNIYSILNGAKISQTPANNPVFRNTSPYSKRKYREIILKMNDSIPRRLRQPPEL